MDPILSKLLWIFSTFLIMRTTTEAAYLKPQCGFYSANYSIEWAFEPQTQNVVFVLRTNAPREFGRKEQSLTGVGFGQEKKIEFVGISAQPSDGQMRIFIAHSDDEGQIQWNPVGQDTEVKGISLKTLSNGDIIAEFARPLSAFGDQNELSGCMTFYFPIQWLEIVSGKSTFPTSTTKQRQICGLSNYCRLELDGLNKESTEIKHLDTSEVEISQSVDISGKGDPCSFNGVNNDVKWSYNRATDSAEFILRQKPKRGRWWTAIGIGDNMSDMDIGVIFLNDGVPEGMGDYFSRSYDVPTLDIRQDWELDKDNSKKDGGNLVKLHFSRKIETNDTENDRSMDGCVLFQFAVNSGPYDDEKNIHKHEDWPDLYKACDLKKRCVRQKRENSNGEAGQGKMPEVSHSIDGQNGSQTAETVKEKKIGKIENETEIGDRMISLLMKAIGPKIVQTVAESETENNKSQSKETKVNEKGQEENIQNVLNGEKNREQHAVGLKSIPEKKQEVLEKGNNGVESTQATAESSTDTTSGGITEAPTSVEGQAQQPADGGGSPFSLNAFLGNQTEDLPRVGEPAKNTEQIGENEPQNGNKTTTKQPRFDISQMLGDGGVQGTINDVDQNRIGNQNETSDIIVPTNESNMTTVNIGSTTINGTIEEEQNPEEQAVTEIENVLLHPLNNTSATSESDVNGTSTSAITTSKGVENTTEMARGTEEENIATSNTINSPRQEVTTTKELIPSTTIPIVNVSNTVAEGGSEGTSTPLLKSNTITPSMNIVTNESITENTPALEEIITEKSSTNVTIESSTTISMETTEREETHSISPTLSAETTQRDRVEVDGGGSNSIEEEQGQTQRQNASSEVQTTTSSLRETEGNRVSATSGIGEEGIKLPVARSKCDALRPDLPICKSYMDTYLSRVKEWADKHGEPMQDQYGKACKLLSAVPHVPTLCCQVFADKCTNHI